MQKFMKKSQAVMQELWGESGCEYQDMKFTGTFMAGDTLNPVEIGGVLHHPSGAIRMPKSEVTTEPEVGKKVRIGGKEWRIIRVVARSWELDWYCELETVGR